MIFKGKRRDKEADKVRGVVIEYTNNGWMNEEKVIRWVQMIWQRHQDDTRRLFSWDSYRCHLTERVKSALASHNTDCVVIPGGTTSLLQVGLLIPNCHLRYIIILFICRLRMSLGISHSRPIIRNCMMTGQQLERRPIRKGAMSDLHQSNRSASG